MFPYFFNRSESRGSKHRHKHHDRYKQEDLLLRRQKGSEVHLEDAIKRVPTESDEAQMLHSADLDDITSHRFEHVRGIRRHKVRKSKHSMTSIVHIGKVDKAKSKIFRPKKNIDHSPHEVFVELDELYGGEGEQYEWREKARWIKFEEDVEEGAERWGKPHVASLSFHSLLELRRGLENGTLLLDLEAEDLPSIVNAVIDNMIIHDCIKAENKGKVLRTLLLKHKHQRDKLSLMKSMSSQSFKTSPSFSSFEKPLGDSAAERLLKSEDRKPEKMDVKNLEFVKVDVDNNMTSDNTHIGITTDESRQKNIQNIMRRIPKDAEAITVLVGCVDFLDKPAMAFVRLAKGIVLDNLTEVPLPVRFLFILLGPEKGGMDYHEVGRSISTLMSNQHFHDNAYRAVTRQELLGAINEFLDESIVLPPGEWDQKTLLPITAMARRKARIKRRKREKEKEKQQLIRRETMDKIPMDPIKRTGRIFGGLINDIRRRYPFYKSDFTDAFNLHCVATSVFIFFACFAPCITFGGLLSEKTVDYMGVTETMISTSITGVVFGLFSAQPMMLLGATGPVLVFEQVLYKVCSSNQIEFLTARVWIGFWVMVITLIVIAAESSFLIRYITRFTEEIFTILISLIFIYEVIKKVEKIYYYHPLRETSYYCNMLKVGNCSMSDSVINGTSHANYTHDHSHDIKKDDSKRLCFEDDGHHHLWAMRPEPNTALFSTILIFGTFLIAYFLRVFRNSKFLGRSARRALGDFGVVIAMMIMVILDFSVQNVYTQKLSIPNTLEPTDPEKRGWFVHPMGTKEPIKDYFIILSILPALLLFILLFLETQITEMTLNKKEFKLKKGSGFHLDQVLLGVMTFVLALFGLPWMCSATVRTLCHVSALSVMSRTHAPGEKPKLLSVREQRVTNIVIHAMIGLSLMAGPLLRAIPVAVLFGIFLYVGVSALTGLQMFRRMKLLLIPVKHHPTVGFVRRVRTFKMHIFTIIQVMLLCVLLVTKVLGSVGLVFPLLVILLIPFRIKVLPKIFSEKELEELDKLDEDSEDEDDDEPDFYQQAHMPI
ncbi:hypothetical protein FSP39_020709 [Pinctada imbricata]|uniref:Anion exchange protein n=1 Tax=Pinctada imbricata TaxID=66713 RepID=A0AA89BL46_PINIB|nr:hypothetical protein FSP39_020709 [Pinctada imbricata]